VTIQEDISQINQASMALLEKQDGIQEALYRATAALDSKFSQIDARICAPEGSLDPTPRTQDNQLMDMAPIDAATLVGALGNFYPILRKGVSLLTEGAQAALSDEAAYWILEEYQDLVRRVFTATAGGLKKSSEKRIISANSDIPPKAPRVGLHMRVRRPVGPGIKAISTVQALPTMLSHVSACRASDQPHKCTAKMTVDSGDLFAVLEGTQWKNTWPVGNEDLGRVSICFIPKDQVGLPSIAASFMRFPGKNGIIDSVLSTSNVLPPNAEVLGHVADGNYPEVLKILRAGKASASDRDHNGRSLLSVSRNLTAMILIPSSLLI
jgi:hypothetical protein